MIKTILLGLVVLWQSFGFQESVDTKPLEEVINKIKQLEGHAETIDKKIELADLYFKAGWLERRKHSQQENGKLPKEVLNRASQNYAKSNEIYTEVINKYFVT